MDGWVEVPAPDFGLGWPWEVAASHGFGVEIPPFHAEVLGPFLAFLSFWQKWENDSKTSAWDGVFGSFSHFGQNGQNSLRV